MSEEPIYRSPTVRVIDEFGHVEVSWPDPPRPWYEVAHEVIAEMVEMRNRYADMIQRGGDRARMVCPECTLTQRMDPNLPVLRCMVCGTGYWDEADQ